MKKILILFLMLSGFTFSMGEFWEGKNKAKVLYDDRNWEIKNVDGIRGISPKNAYKPAIIFIKPYKNTPVQGKEIIEEIKKEIKAIEKLDGNISVREVEGKSLLSYTAYKDEKKYKYDVLIFGDFYGYYEVTYVALDSTYDKFKDEALEILKSISIKK